MMMLAPLVARSTPLHWRMRLKTKLYWAHQLGTWTLWDEASFAALSLLGGVGGFMLGIADHAGWLMLVMVSGVGALLPYTQMNSKAELAQRTVRRQLPEIIQLIATEVAGGSSIAEALERTGQGHNLASKWIRETLQAAHGRSLFSRDEDHKGVLYLRSKETGLPELVALARELDHAQKQGYGTQENLSRMATRSAKDFLRAMKLKAKELESKLVVPVVVFFFLPFLVAVIIPIGLPLLQSLQVQ